MPVKTRPRPVHRTRSYRPRSSPARRPPSRRARRSFPSLPRPSLAWLALPLLGIAGFIFLFMGPLIDAVESVLRGFGLGILLIAALAVVDTRVAMKRPDLTREFLRVWGGAHLLCLFAFGVASLIRPG